MGLIFIAEENIIGNITAVLIMGFGTQHLFNTIPRIKYYVVIILLTYYRDPVLIIFLAG